MIDLISIDTPVPQFIGHNKIFLCSAVWLNLWAGEVFLQLCAAETWNEVLDQYFFLRLDILINIKETSCNILDRCSVICDSDLQL